MEKQKTVVMKRIFFSLILVLSASAVVMAQQTTPATQAKPQSAAKIEFEKETVDYGTIEQGADPFRIFKFKNTGSEPLVIKSAKGSCGCTVPTYPQEPIMPGQSGEIKVRYDTNRTGSFTKRVTLTTNVSDQEVVLTIMGKVEPKPAEPAGLPAGDGNMFKN